MERSRRRATIPLTQAHESYQRGLRDFGVAAAQFVTYAEEVARKTGLILSVVVLGCLAAFTVIRDGRDGNDRQMPAPAADDGRRIAIVGDPSSVVYCIGNTRRPPKTPIYHCYDHEGRPTTETITPP